MVDFPPLAEDFRVKKLSWPEGRLPVVLDTDTFNEVDDQFALAYLMRSPERFDLQAVYAAPFWNDRSTGPAEGMEKSYQEIVRLLEVMDQPPRDGFLYKGATQFLSDEGNPIVSEAALDLIARAHAVPETLYVIGIAAATNVASALLIDPSIREKIVVIWLGGHAPHSFNTHEFNLQEDPVAARVLLDCGVPLVRIPCADVLTALHTTVPELAWYLEGKTKIGSYLVKIVREYGGDHWAWSKVLWDIAPVAHLINSSWVPSVLAPSPVLTDQLTWSFDARRPLIRTAYAVDRDAIFGDLFRKLASVPREVE